MKAQNRSQYRHGFKWQGTMFNNGHFWQFWALIDVRNTEQMYPHTFDKKSWTECNFTYWSPHSMESPHRLPTDFHTSQLRQASPPRLLSIRVLSVKCTIVRNARRNPSDIPADAMPPPPSVPSVWILRPRAQPWRSSLYPAVVERPWDL